jgi:hypothetical protein
MRGRFERYWNMDVIAGLKAEATGRNLVEKRMDLLEKARDVGGSL